MNPEVAGAALELFMWLFRAFGGLLVVVAVIVLPFSIARRNWL